MGNNFASIGRRRAIALLGGTAAALTWGSPALADDRLTDRFGIFYFFAQTCGVCKQQSPVLREFADRSAITVVAVSEDGGMTPEFPHYRVDTGQRARMGLAGNTTPTIALFDTRTHRVVEIAEGFIDEADLARRIAAAARTLAGEGA